MDTSLTFEQLQTFRTIVHAGTFTRAAQELYLSQPAISQRVKHLEQVLGTRLFDRDHTGRMPHLTPAGEVVLRFADEALALLEHLHAELVSNSGSDEVQTVTIACGPGVSTYLMPGLLSALWEQYPHVRPRVVGALPDKVSEAVQSGEAELGVAAASLIDPALQRALFIKDRLVLVAASDHPILHESPPRPQELALSPFILPSTNSEVRRATERWAESLGLRLNVVLEVASLHAIKEAVLQGIGIAVAPEFTMLEELRDGHLRVVPTTGFPQERHLFVIYDGSRPLSPAAQAVLEIVRAGTWRPSASSAVLA